MAEASILFAGVLLIRGHLHHRSQKLVVEVAAGWQDLHKGRSHTATLPCGLPGRAIGWNDTSSGGRVLRTLDVRCRCRCCVLCAVEEFAERMGGDRMWPRTDLHV